MESFHPSRTDQPGHHGLPDSTYRLIVEQAPIPILVYNDKGRILILSRGWTDATGLDLAGIPSLDDFWPNVDSADDTLREVVLKAPFAETGAEFRAETVYRVQGKEPRNWILSITALGQLEDGECGAVLRAMDVTARVAVEKKLQESRSTFESVLDAALDAVVVMDAAGIVREWRGSASEMFGWSASEAVGTALADLIVPERFREAHWNGLRRYLQTGEARVLDQRLELSAIRRSGEEFPAEVAIVATQRGLNQTFAGYIRDLSDAKAAETEIYALSKQLEERIKERTADLEASNNELEALTYSIAHDIRTSMRGLVINSRFLFEEERDNVTPEGRGRLQRLESAALKLSDMVDDILTFARLRTLAPKPTDIDLVPLIRSAIEIAETEYGNPVTLAAPPSLIIRMDESLGTAMILNLVDNAVKYSPGGSPALHVGYKLINGKTVYFLQDRGVGFDMEYAEKIFEPFLRLHRDDEFPGTGIGLANVKRIVERHGGEVWVESAINQGTTVFFTLEAD